MMTVENRVLMEASLDAYDQGVIDGKTSRDADVAELATGLDKTLKCIRYMQGIAERGFGRKMLDEEATDLFLLAYVKSIEQERDQLRDQVTLAKDYFKKLACFGNGDRNGTSYGNLLAQEALRKIEALATTEPKP